MDMTDDVIEMLAEYYIGTQLAQATKHIGVPFMLQTIILQNIMEAAQTPWPAHNVYSYFTQVWDPIEQKSKPIQIKLEFWNRKEPW